MGKAQNVKLLADQLRRWVEWENDESILMDLLSSPLAREAMSSFASSARSPYATALGSLNKTAMKIMESKGAGFREVKTFDFQHPFTILARAWMTTSDQNERDLINEIAEEKKDWLRDHPIFPNFEGKSPMACAAEAGWHEGLKLLLERAPSLTKYRYENGHEITMAPPMAYATDAETIKMLIDAGASPDCCHHDGVRLITHLGKMGEVKSVELLLMEGAKRDIGGEGNFSLWGHLSFDALLNKMPMKVQEKVKSFDEAREFSSMMEEAQRRVRTKI